MRRTDAECPDCGNRKLDFYLQAGESYPECVCGARMEWLPRAGNQQVVPDDIPGGVLIEHGLCNPDGTPKRYYSRSEIRLACAVKGLIPWTDVYTEDRTKDARVRAEWLQSSEAQRARRDRVEARAEKHLAKQRMGQR